MESKVKMLKIEIEGHREGSDKEFQRLLKDGITVHLWKWGEQDIRYFLPIEKESEPLLKIKNEQVKENEFLFTEDL